MSTKLSSKENGAAECSNGFKSVLEVDEKPAILKIRSIDLVINDPDVTMCGCHCISYCSCDCDRGGIIS